MPIPLAPILSGVASVAGNLLSNSATQRNNARQEAFAREMYDKQQSDNMKLWQMQNEYNSPTSQMERLKQAGLNPNLVYGAGTSTMASPIKSADVPSFNPTPSKFELGQAAQASIQAYNDFRMRDAQIQNLAQQTNVAKQQSKQIEANTVKTVAETEALPWRAKQAMLDYVLKDSTINSNIDAVKLKALQASADYGFKQKSYENILKGQVLDNLYKEQKNAKTALERNYLESVITKIKNDIRLQGPEIKFAEQFSGSKGMQGAGLGIQLLRTIFGK